MGYISIITAKNWQFLASKLRYFLYEIVQLSAWKAVFSGAWNAANQHRWQFFFFVKNGRHNIFCEKRLSYKNAGDCLTKFTSTAYKLITAIEQSWVLTLRTRWRFCWLTYIKVILLFYRLIFLSIVYLSYLFGTRDSVVHCFATIRLGMVLTKRARARMYLTVSIISWPSSKLILRKI